MQVRPSGFRVRLLRPGITSPRLPGIQPLLVRVAFRGYTVRPGLYLASQSVSWDDLGTQLEKELRLRPPDWPVYVEGDPDLDWRSVAEAIDAIRGLNADVVLLTRRHSPTN